MRLSQSQIEACRQMEAAGGPANESESRLYTHYLRTKAQKIHEKSQADAQVDNQLARAAYGMKQLESELTELEQELDEHQQRLDELVKEATNH